MKWINIKEIPKKSKAYIVLVRVGDGERFVTHDVYDKQHGWAGTNWDREQYTHYAEFESLELPPET